jgi:hypothetical protein
MLTLGTFEKDPKTDKISGTFYGVNMYPTKLIFEPSTSGKGNPYIPSMPKASTRPSKPEPHGLKRARVENPIST